VAALLIAKASQAGERGVELRIADGTRLGRVDEPLSADLTTVVGNLVDNALDAIGHAPDGWVAVQIGQENGHVRVVVRDSGPGVAPELAEEVFEHGFTTKAAADGQRGIGAGPHPDGLRQAWRPGERPQRQRRRVHRRPAGVRGARR
jgi:sensor histidine kinase regulating citrate/malate metabolism